MYLLVVIFFPLFNNPLCLSIVGNEGIKGTRRSQCSSQSIH